MFLLLSVAAHPAIAPFFRPRALEAGDVGDRAVRSVVYTAGDGQSAAEKKANWLDAMCTLDARLPLVREVARRFAMSRSHDPNNPDALARDYARLVRDGIKYVKDPAGEELSDAQVTLRQGYGDCDDKARLFVALCRSMQIPARIRPCFTGEEFVHVQAEVDQNGTWTIVELIVRGVGVGRLPPRGKQVLQ